VALTHLRRLLFDKKYLIALVKSSPIMFQLCLKNSVVKPSRLGALSSRMKNKADLISSLEID
jgi:hypothetical protein